MTRNNLKDPRQEDFNYKIQLLYLFLASLETTLSWQLKHLYSTSYNGKYYRKRELL